MNSVIIFVPETPPTSPISFEKKHETVFVPATPASSPDESTSSPIESASSQTKSNCGNREISIPHYFSQLFAKDDREENSLLCKLAIQESRDGLELRKSDLRPTPKKKARILKLDLSSF